MFVISQKSTPTCIVVDVEGAVSGDEYDEFTDTIERALNSSDAVNLVVNITGSVKYSDRDAVEEDLEFVTHEYRSVRRAAFVGDQRLVRAMVKVFSPFTRTQERLFDAGEVDAAIEWADSQDPS